MKTAYFFRCAILIFFLISASRPVFAGGGSAKEKEKFAESERLISEKNYEAAIIALIDLVKKNPDEFDNIQNRMRGVMRTMNDYTQIANMLLDIVAARPDDMDNILRLSRQLTEMSIARNDQVNQFILGIEEVARFTVNRRELENILAQGRLLLDRKDYLGAMRMYQTGFVLYREQMFASDFDAGLKNRTRNYLNDIDNFINSLGPISSAFASAGEAAVATADMQTLIAAWNNLQPSLNTFIDMKKNILEIRNFLETESTLLTESENKNEGRYFFQTAPVFITGRTTEDKREGVLGVMDAIWINALDPLALYFDTMADSLFSTSISNAALEDFSGMAANVSLAEQINVHRMNLINEWLEFTAVDNVPVQTILGTRIPQSKANDFLKIQAMNRSLISLAKGAALGSDYASVRDAESNANTINAWSTKAITVSAAVNQERNIRRRYAEVDRSLQTALNDLAAVRAEFSRSTALVQSSNGQITNYFDRAADMLQQLGRGIYAGDLLAANNLYTIRNSDLDTAILSLEKTFNEGSSLASGSPLQLDNGDEIIAKYPREALAIWTQITGNLSSATAASVSLNNDYNAESARIAQDNGIAQKYAQARELAQRLAAFTLQHTDAQRTARAQLEASETLRAQGEALIAEARRSLASNNFDAAHDQVELSSARFNESFALQTSVNLRRATDERLVALNTEITRGEYEWAVREVRSLVNSAREIYFEGGFDRAEDRLVNAENRWARVSTEPDEEVTYWLAIVRGALSLRSGRILAPTAPLYPEISQLLSTARKNYDEGILLFNSNRRAAGIEKFELARLITQEVRLMFPVNQDAGILELRIDQVIDPANFNQTFIARLNAAIAGTKRGSTESFADLQNLAQINPRYPGINAAINQAEIDMGLRPRPMDPRILARSNELAAIAQRLLNANVQSQYQLVLDNANEALRLNPTNTLAMNIKDRVQVAMGVGLGAADSQTEQEFLRAVTEFQRGNSILAFSIVQRLLQRPENRSSVRINELLRRIQSSM